MEDILIVGLPLRRVIEMILSLVAMILFLIDGDGAFGGMVPLSIMVFIYITLLIVLGLCRRSDMMSSAATTALDCIFGVLIVMEFIQYMAYDINSPQGAMLAAFIIEFILGIILLISQLV